MAQRILIIDDEDHIRQVMRLTLEAAGYEAGEAADGPRGLEAFGDGSTWDAVLLDQKMPGMDGLETLRHIKDRQAGCAGHHGHGVRLDRARRRCHEARRHGFRAEADDAGDFAQRGDRRAGKAARAVPPCAEADSPRSRRGGSSACQPAHHERVPILARSRRGGMATPGAVAPPLCRSTPGRPTPGDGRGTRHRGHRARRARDAASPSSREHVLVLAGRTSPECVSLERRESTAWREVDDRGESNRSRYVADGYALGKPGLVLCRARLIAKRSA